MDDIEKAYRAFERHDAFYDKLNEATVQSGTLAVRSAFILNGGACLALLAFAANTLTADSLSQGQGRLVLQILGSLSLFAWGAFAAAIATGLAFLANRVAVEANLRMAKHIDPPYLRRGPNVERLFRVTDGLQLAAVVVTITSLILFMIALLKVASNIPSA
jgi:hypothetical protein